MTLIIFIIAVVSVYLARWNGIYLVIGDLTVYQIAFYSTLLCATIFAINTHQRRFFISAMVLCLSGVLSQRLWFTDDPILDTAIMDLMCAAWFFLYGKTRYEFQISVIFSASVLVGYFTYSGFIPDQFARNSSTVIAWSHPDLTAILGHFASITLGAGAGDGGKSIQSYLRSLPLAFNWRDRMANHFIWTTKN